MADKVTHNWTLWVRTNDQKIRILLMKVTRILKSKNINRKYKQLKKTSQTVRTILCPISKIVRSWALPLRI